MTGFYFRLLTLPFSMRTLMSNLIFMSRNEYDFEDEKFELVLPLDNHEVDKLMELDDEGLIENIPKIHEVDDLKLVFFAARARKRNSVILKHLSEKILKIEGGENNG